MKNRVILVSVLVVCMVFAVQCRNKQSPTETPSQETGSRAIAEVTAATVREGPVSRVHTAVGILAPRDFARISPKVSGRIDDIPVEEGDRIESGDVLMQIDSFDYGQILDNRTALRNQARVHREKALRDLTRIDRLVRDQTVSEQAYHDTKTTFDLAAYALDQATVAFRKAARDLRECRVTAPISGILTGRHVSEGELTGPSAVAFVIMQMDRVKVAVDLPEDAYRHVRTGDPCRVTVDAVPGGTFGGTITKIYPVIDPASRTAKITVAIDNPQRKLRSGMTARAKIIQKARESALHAPVTAFVKGEEGYFVYRLLSDRVHRVPVEIGVLGEGVLEVTQGLEPGDQVVIGGLTGLRHGMSVKIRTEEGVE